MNKIPRSRAKGLVFLWAVIIAVSGWSLSVNYKEQLRTSHELACDREFRSVLIENRGNNTELFNQVMQLAENDKKWRDALSHPPPELYGRFDQDRADWLIKISMDASARTDDLLGQMVKTLQDRNNNQYPDIACGRT